MVQTSFVGRFALGSELRRLRIENHVSLEYLAGAIGMTASKLSRLERGLPTVITTEDVSGLLGFMRITGKARERVMSLAAGQVERGYGLWEMYDPDAADQVQTYPFIERLAKRVINVQPLLVPDLLQTADYCRSLFNAIGISDLKVRGRMARRLGRSAAFELANRTNFLFAISESVLRQPVGSELLMARQVRHLISETSRERVAVRVVPQAVVAHPGLLGSFTLLEFEDRPTVAYIESRMSAFFLENPAEVAALIDAADRQVAKALNEDDSSELMHTIAEDLEKGRGRSDQTDSPSDWGSLPTTEPFCASEPEFPWRTDDPTDLGHRHHLQLDLRRHADPQPARPAKFLGD